MRILLIYHFFHPDEVVSARMFSDLAEELAKAGHEVTAYCSNRHKRQRWELPPFERWHEVEIRRFFRPNFSQKGNFRRLLNSLILQLKWLRSFFRNRGSFDAVILGTDPQFGYLMFPFLHWIDRRVKLIHWCFDLYPDAIFAGSPLWMRFLAHLTKPFARFSCRYVDLMAELGPAMRKRLQKYNSHCRYETLMPWALYEPAEIPPVDLAVRRELFGDAKLGILYSGTVGAAHDVTPFIELARECRKQKIDAAFCFAGYGSRFASQTALLTPEDTNVRLAGFADEKALDKRLAAADLHLISLRPGWNGIVFPSKFFAALAVGRPLLFYGDASSDLGAEIEHSRVGWNFQEIASAARLLRQLIDDPEQLRSCQRSAFACYRDRFSRAREAARWRALFEGKP